MSFLLPEDRRYLTDKDFLFEEVIDQSKKGLIIHKYQLPLNRFDLSEVALLLLLPPTYPDIPPPKFYVSPRIKLAQTKRDARATSHSITLSNRTWQLWSRNIQNWRPGIDGIWTALKNIDLALETAI